MKAHIVRLKHFGEPITRLRCQKPAGVTSLVADLGILWAVFGEQGFVQNTTFGAPGQCKNPLLEYVHSKALSGPAQNSIVSCATGCRNIKEWPVIRNVRGSGSSGGCAIDSALVRVLSFENCKLDRMNGLFSDNTALELIEFNNVDTSGCGIMTTTFQNCYSLKRLPPLDFTSVTDMNFFLVANTSLEPTWLDLSAATLLKRVVCAGNGNTKRLNGLKGLIVSPRAPFNAASPQINVSYSGLERPALLALFESLPAVTAGQKINITAAEGAALLTQQDLDIALNKGWQIIR
ncbi:MAG: hypothetical protein LBR90_05020 [Elusimicrobiota bacterium]|jgi:hypothetical protein|nr:hypothetical protein [Elusimicrobiota bacterium]